MPEQDNGGLRYDAGKPRFDLIPPDALLALAQHYAKGAEKYEPRNWERGMDWCRVYGSLQRHANKWMANQEIDKDSGSHHMIAVAWNALALYCYETRGVGVDDRPLIGVDVDRVGLLPSD